MEDDKKADLKRRSFLLTMGAGSAGALAAGAAAASRTAPGVAPAVEAATAQARDGDVTEHMRKYYRSARI